MASQNPKFDLKFMDESSYDDTIFITQTFRDVDNEENILDQSVAEIDMESLMNSSRDSAINTADEISVQKVDKSPKHIVAISSSKPYQPEVENMTESEERLVFFNQFKFYRKPHD